MGNIYFSTYTFTQMLRQYQDRLSIAFILFSGSHPFKTNAITLTTGNSRKEQQKNAGSESKHSVSHSRKNQAKH